MAPRATRMALGVAGLCLMAGGLLACSGQNTQGLTEPGFLRATPTALRAYGLGADSLPEVSARDVGDVSAAVMDIVQADTRFDPYCTRFFDGGDVVVAVLRMWCDLPNVTLSDNAIAVTIYSVPEQTLGPIVVDWRRWFSDLAPPWQPPLDPERARQTPTTIRG